MYTATTMTNPWQSGSFVPQQCASQSFPPFQSFPQMAGYNMPMQMGGIAASPWGYSMPFSAGGIQGSYIPQGSISYSYNPGWGWQPISPVAGSQVGQINPQMQQHMSGMGTPTMAPPTMGIPAMGIPTMGINATTGFAQPRVELAETNNDVIVTADLPNVDPNNIYITATDDSLSISALAHMGGTTNSLHRTVALPTSIRSEHVNVSYTNGMLECRLPKSDLTARRRIKVNPAG